MTRPRPTVDPVPGVPSGGLPVLFLHIPRTGGSTVKFMLQSAYGISSSLVDAHLFRTAGEDLSGLAFVEGHLNAGFFARTFGEGWRANAITMLRDPVSRVVSQARHIRARPGPFHERLAGRVRDPESVFDAVPRLANLQTKQLSRAPIEARDVGDDALEEAKANLEQIAFGLTEDVDTAVALLVERFGFAFPRFDVANAARGLQDDDLCNEEFEAVARRRNEMDERLYAFAADLMRTRVRSYAETLLALPADGAELTCRLRFRGRYVEDHLEVPANDPRGRLSGWVLVDGRAPDAVLMRMGEHVIPLATGVERDDAARLTRDLHNRRAGVLRAIELPPDSGSIELIAIDRTRQVRAEKRIPVTFIEPESLPVRAVMAATARLDRVARRLLRR